MLSTLHGFISVTINWYYEQSLFIGEEMGGSEKFRHLPKVTELVSDGAGV